MVPTPSIVQDHRTTTRRRRGGAGGDGGATATNSGGSREHRPSRPSSTKSSSPYQEAADILRKIRDDRISFKTAVFGISPQAGRGGGDSGGGHGRTAATMNCSRTTYAIVAQVLQYRALLESIIELVPGIKAKNTALLHILLYELLLSPKQSIQGGGALRRQVLELEPILRQLLLQQQPRHPQLDSLHRLAPMPRYVRINTLQSTTEEMVKLLQQQLHLPVYADAQVPDLLVLPAAYASSAIGILKTHEHIIKPNSIVLQDKSSCFPALCLVHGYATQRQDHMMKQLMIRPIQKDNDAAAAVEWMDACAAPGNKTSHLAALLKQLAVSTAGSPKAKKNTIKILALDRDKRRCAALKSRMDQLVNHVHNNGDSGSSNHWSVQVRVQHQDFLSINPLDYPRVYGILLDPTCSGSGILNSLDRHHHHHGGPPGQGEANSYHDTTIRTRDVGEDDDTGHNSRQPKDKRHGMAGQRRREDNERLEALARVQVQMLQHALSFPSAQRVVYSTCSIHESENEHVVAQVLRSPIGQHWELVSPACLSQWPRRGHDLPGALIGASTGDAAVCSSDRSLTAEQSGALIRVQAPDDGTNGFFLSCWQRKAKHSSSDNNGSSSSRSRQPEKEQWDEGSSLPAIQNEWKDRSHVLGLEVYRHGHGNDPDEDNVAAKEDPIRPLPPSSSAGTMTSSSTGRNPVPRNGHDNAGANIHATKRAKKQKWKQRQHDLKTKRLLSKKQKPEEGPKK